MAENDFGKIFRVTVYKKIWCQFPASGPIPKFPNQIPQFIPKKPDILFARGGVPNMQDQPETSRNDFRPLRIILTRCGVAEGFRPVAKRSGQVAKHISQLRSSLAKLRSVLTGCEAVWPRVDFRGTRVDLWQTNRPLCRKSRLMCRKNQFLCHKSRLLWHESRLLCNKNRFL